MKPTLLTVMVVLGLLFLGALLVPPALRRAAEPQYAIDTIYDLNSNSDWALRSEVPQAATILGHVSRGTNAWQRPGTAWDNRCNVKRSNVVVSIIAYLRTKTGENLGDSPEPWIQKYSAKEDHLPAEVIKK